MDASPLPRVLTEFAADLRQLRSAAGHASIAALARNVHYSASSLAAITSGTSLPSRAITLAYVRACGGDVQAWEQRWKDTRAALKMTDRRASGPSGTGTAYATGTAPTACHGEPGYTPIDYRILGPLELIRAGRPLPMARRQMAVILAALLLDAGTVVSTDSLSERLWGDHPPRTGRTIIQCNVSRLRQLMSPLPGSADDPIITRCPGYMLCIDPEQLDLLRFDRLVREGTQLAATGSISPASIAFRAALDLWRGPALAGIGSDTLRWAAIPYLEERRLAATEQWMELELRLGRESRVVPEVEALVAEYPLRERFRGLLMLALARAGRQAEALTAYQDARNALNNELGVEPCPELQALHQAILTQDGTLFPPRQRACVVAARAAVCTLPASVPHFTGQDDALTMIRAALADPGNRLGSQPVTIVGCPGVGKTALAIHVAYCRLGAFPDASLFVDLAGTGMRPLSEFQALGELIKGLTGPGIDLPNTLYARRNRYRELTGGRRVMVIFDDVRDEAHVRPLLPMTPGSAVLLTSRSRLDGLLGCTHLAIEPLDQSDSTELLESLIGGERVSAEPDAAQSMVACCAGLPLALSIMAARVAARPTWPLAVFAERLSREDTRLSELRAGDLSLCDALAPSYQRLQPEERRSLRALAHLGDRSFGTRLAARALGRPPSTATKLLEMLVDAHLLRALGQDVQDCDGGFGYRFNPLLRLYILRHMQCEPEPSCPHQRIGATTCDNPQRRTRAGQTPRLLTASAIRRAPDRR